MRETKAESVSLIVVLAVKMHDDSGKRTLPCTARDVRS